MCKESVETKFSLLKKSALLVVLGILDSLYLVYHHVEVTRGFQQGSSFCNLGGMINCDEVAKSAYSEFFDIPVASLGAWYYLVFLSLIIFFWGNTKSAQGKTAQGKTMVADALFFYSVLALPSTLFFSYISIFKINYICISCSFLYLVNLALVYVSWRENFRTRGIVASLRNGFLCLWRELIQAEGESSVLRLGVFWASSLLALVLLAFAPYLLVKGYFLPREASLGDEDYLRLYYEEWKRAPQHDISLVEQESASEKDFSYGSPHASLVIVEFSDFQCPFCRRAAQALESLVDSSRGKVRLVFKQYPLDRSCNSVIETEYHKYACQAALMVRCAGSFGDEYFWRMHDKLFSLESDDWGADRLLALPKELGLDPKVFDECLSNPASMRRVQQDIALGQKLDVPGTPSIYLKGRRLRFDRLEVLSHLIAYIEKQEAAQASNK